LEKNEICEGTLPPRVSDLAFRAKLTRPPGVGTWTFAVIPAAVIDRQGLRSHSRVVGTIDGAPFRSSCIPRGGGTLYVVVPQPLRERIGKGPGDVVKVAVRLDTTPVVVRLPADLRAALGTDRAKFDRLAPSHRKAFVVWIEGAKQVETRARRVATAVQMIRRGETRN